jgi:hypothetical protein
MLKGVGGSMCDSGWLSCARFRLRRGMAWHDFRLKLHSTRAAFSLAQDEQWASGTDKTDSFVSMLVLPAVFVNKLEQYGTPTTPTPRRNHAEAALRSVDVCVHVT